jgi:hypothetical protein
MQRVSHARFWSVHIAAKFGGHHGTARLSIGGSHANATQKRMQRDAHGKIGIESAKSGPLAGIVNIVEPDFFRQRRVEHGCVAGGIQRAETGRQRPHAKIAVHSQVQKMDDQRIARFGAINVKRAGERVIALHQRERIAGLADGIAEGVERIRLQDVAGMKMGHGPSYSIDVFHIVYGGAVMHGAWSRVLGLRMRDDCKGHKNQEGESTRDGPSIEPEVAMMRCAIHDASCPIGANKMSCDVAIRHSF